ncbi:MAG: AAA family ATPase [Nitrospirota bacterium]
MPSNSQHKFTWIPIYHELAEQLLQWQERQSELIAFLEGLRSKKLVITPLNDQDDQGARFILKEIDPFTFFGVFNRGIREDQRLSILAEIKKSFNLKNELPHDFEGIPLVNNQKSWFIPYQYRRNVDDVSRLWKVFRLALGDKPLDHPEFLKAFDDALNVRNTNLNLTMGLFWIRPDIFLNLDQTNRQYLKIKLPSGGLSAQFYKDTVRAVSSKFESLPELSMAAWIQATKQPEPKAPRKSPEAEIGPDNNYWMVGAYWSDNDPPDQTERFVAEGIWENGYEDRLLDEVRSMKVGDKIAIKAASTQRSDLPFEAHGKTVSRMTIKAIGTIVANRGDGRVVEIEWDPSFKAKDWYFYTNQQTLWKLRRDDPYAKRLIDFAFGNAEQDYAWFIDQLRGTDKSTAKTPVPPEKPGTHQPYGIADMISSGVFLTDAELNDILERLQSKKNMILQGPPGVGKTFIAKKIAYCLMEEIDDQRIEMVQFHQSYSYEDFIRGYRPLPDKAGAFGLFDGVFMSFCEKARKDDRPHIFIIDEINRGNLSQIFGELLMLIETDKRGPEYMVPLVYRRPEEARFYIPQNVYLIGLMNVADRSLAMVDYALRRRFAFITLKPEFENVIYRRWLLERNMNPDLAKLIIDRISALNKEISDDPLLGPNYQVGHSFFCPRGNNFAGLDRSWYDGVVKTEIIPLLKEYWFDNPKRAEQVSERLLS